LKRQSLSQNLGDVKMRSQHKVYTNHNGQLKLTDWQKHQSNYDSEASNKQENLCQKLLQKWWSSVAASSIFGEDYEKAVILKLFT